MPTVAVAPLGALRGCGRAARIGLSERLSISAFGAIIHENELTWIRSPVARVEPVTDSHFGERVIDPYRWMEIDKDPAWLAYLKGQNDHARAVLGTLPRRDALLARIQQLSGDIAVPAAVRRAGGRLFFQQRPAGANNFKLFVLEGARTRVLVDPTTLDSADSHYSLDWWEPSHDGSRLAYGLSKDGSEDSTLQVMDVSSGAILPERIPNTEHASPQWLACLLYTSDAADE